MTEDAQRDGGQDAGTGRRLSTNEQSTISELRRLDPELAGLFERGLSLADEIEQPGVRYLVAHVGREVSRAMISTLTGETTVEPMPVADDAERESRFRKRIAAVLDLPEAHPNVTAWFHCHQILVGGVHWRQPHPSASVVRESFVTLGGLLFGRIAPYFDTQAELDQLLQIKTPTIEDAERLQRCTVRYTQRRYFFTRLSETLWLPQLAVAGFFRNPPDRLMHADGSWSIQHWPEGDALARLAGGAPDVVVKEFAEVPRANQNPAVWKAIAAAALAMAPADALRLVPLMVHGLKNAPPVLFQRSVIDVIQRLAQAGHRDGAFALTDALLFVKGTGARKPRPVVSTEGE
jgi:hypothetical protein